MNKGLESSMDRQNIISSDFMSHVYTHVPQETIFDKQTRSCVWGYISPTIIFLFICMIAIVS